jgi:HEAT repeat protein
LTRSNLTELRVALSQNEVLMMSVVPAVHSQCEEAEAVPNSFEDGTLNLLMAGSTEERVAAAHKLGIVELPGAAGYLIAALYDGSYEVRKAAARSLGLIGDAIAIGPLRDLMERERNSDTHGNDPIIGEALSFITSRHSDSDFSIADSFPAIADDVASSVLEAWRETKVEAEETGREAELYSSPEMTELLKVQAEQSQRIDEVAARRRLFNSVDTGVDRVDPDARAQDGQGLPVEARSPAQSAVERAVRIGALRSSIEEARVQRQLLKDEEERLQTELEMLRQAVAEARGRISDLEGERDGAATQLAEMQTALEQERTDQERGQEAYEAETIIIVEEIEPVTVAASTLVDCEPRAVSRSAESSSDNVAAVGYDSEFAASAIRLRSDNPSERSEALGELANLGIEEAFHLITGAFDDSSTEVRNAAARALSDLGNDRAASYTKALREAQPDRRGRICAAFASSGLASEAINCLAGESREVSYDAFTILFLMAKAGEVRPLIETIENHADLAVRLAVIKLLAFSHHADVVTAFRRLAVRGSLPSEVRSALMEAIHDITTQARQPAQSAA